MSSQIPNEEKQPSSSDNSNSAEVDHETVEKIEEIFVRSWELSSPIKAQKLLNELLNIANTHEKPFYQLALDLIKAKRLKIPMNWHATCIDSLKQLSPEQQLQLADDIAANIYSALLNGKDIKKQISIDMPPTFMKPKPAPSAGILSLFTFQKAKPSEPNVPTPIEGIKALLETFKDLKAIPLEFSQLLKLHISRIKTDAQSEHKIENQNAEILCQALTKPYQQDLIIILYLIPFIDPKDTTSNNLANVILSELNNSNNTFVKELYTKLTALSNDQNLNYAVHLPEVRQQIKALCPQQPGVTISIRINSETSLFDNISQCLSKINEFGYQNRYKACFYNYALNFMKTRIKEGKLNNIPLFFYWSSDTFNTEQDFENLDDDQQIACANFIASEIINQVLNRKENLTIGLPPQLSKNAKLEALPPHKNLITNLHTFLKTIRSSGEAYFPYAELDRYIYPLIQRLTEAQKQPVEDLLFEKLNPKDFFKLLMVLTLAPLSRNENLNDSVKSLLTKNRDQPKRHGKTNRDLVKIWDQRLDEKHKSAIERAKDLPEVLGPIRSVKQQEESKKSSHSKPTAQLPDLQISSEVHFMPADEKKNITTIEELKKILKEITTDDIHNLDLVTINKLNHLLNDNIKKLETDSSSQSLKLLKTHLTPDYLFKLTVIFTVYNIAHNPKNPLRDNVTINVFKQYVSTTIPSEKHYKKIFNNWIQSSVLKNYQAAVFLAINNTIQYDVQQNHHISNERLSQIFDLGKLPDNVDHQTILEQIQMEIQHFKNNLNLIQAEHDQVKNGHLGQQNARRVASQKTQIALIIYTTYFGQNDNLQLRLAALTYLSNHDMGKGTPDEICRCFNLPAEANDDSEHNYLQQAIQILEDFIRQEKEKGNSFFNLSEIQKLVTYASQQLNAPANTDDSSNELKSDESLALPLSTSTSLQSSSSNSTSAKFSSRTLPQLQTRYTPEQVELSKLPPNTDSKSPRKNAEKQP